MAKAPPPTPTSSLQRAKGRQVRQPLPKPPPVYDQHYISQLVDAVNDYMIQATAPAEVTAARFVLTDPIVVGTPGDVPDTTSLPTGMVYLTDLPVGPSGTYVLTIVRDTDP